MSTAAIPLLRRGRAWWVWLWLFHPRWAELVCFLAGAVAGGALISLALRWVGVSWGILGA